jgi:uroporphyrinogen III methyltransferase/synthase
VTVYLVGGGPGDPGLLTVRAAELLGRADVVIYDRLSQRSLLDIAPDQAELIDVGKAPGHARRSQEEINELLVAYGRAGAVVVRLKGGDPFVFARGGEEAAALQAAGIAFEVVPGVTSAIAVPAYAGIPVTQRHSSTSVTIVTGHEDPASGEEGTVNWEAVAQVGGTIVILMGIARIRAIAKALMHGGRSPDTPVAVVQWGTRPNQRTVRATLGTIADQELGTPSTIVVGEVAASELTWFERRPLFGRSIVVTRARAQASELVNRLNDLGAETVEVPSIEVREPADGGLALRRSVHALNRYDWVTLTSPNGAQALLVALRTEGLDARALGAAKVAALGPGTAAVLSVGNIVADLVPPQYVAEALLASFPDPPAGRPGHVLLARATVARDVLPDGLRARGWEVDVVDAYQTVAVPLESEQRVGLAQADIVTFTSSSTVTRFVEAAGVDNVPPTVVAIGPITAATAREHGLHVDIEAQVHTIDGLVTAIVDHLSEQGPAHRGQTGST